MNETLTSNAEVFVGQEDNENTMGKITTGTNATSTIGPQDMFLAQIFLGESDELLALVEHVSSTRGVVYVSEIKGMSSEKLMDGIKAEPSLRKEFVARLRPLGLK